MRTSWIFELRWTRIQESAGETKYKGFKNTLISVLVISAIAGIGISGYLNKNKILDLFSSSDKQSEIELKKQMEFEILSKKFNLLNVKFSELEKNYDLRKKEVDEKFDKSNKLQNEVIKGKDEYIANINNYSERLETYEKEMIGRFEQVVNLTAGFATKQESQGQRIKDTVVREVVGIISSDKNNKSSESYLALKKDLEKSENKMAQLEAKVLAQHQMYSFINAEVEYVREKLSRAELAKENVVENKKTQIIVDTSVVDVKKEPTTKIKANNNIDSGFVEKSLAGVKARSKHEYDIYITPTNSTTTQGVVPYIFGPNGASVIPGYGRILAVKELKGSGLRVPYVVITEKGDIRGKR